MFTLCGKLSINRAAKLVFAGASVVPLTRGEYEVFDVLAESIDKELSRETIMSRVYGDSRPQEKILDVRICTMRKKLARATNGDNYIETLQSVGRGYCLRRPSAESL